MYINSKLSVAFLITTMLLLTACGGGGGDTPSPAANIAPTADAGADVTVESGSNVTLSANASSDSDGQIASYNWYQTGSSGTEQVTLSGADTASPSFTATVLTETTFTFTLDVTDNDGATSTDTITITVTYGLASTLDTPWTIAGRTFSLDKVIYTGSKYIGISRNGMAESTDGSNWSAIDFGYNIYMNVAANGNNIVAVPASYELFKGVAMTTDGTSWQTVDLSSNTDCSSLNNISHDGSQFIARHGMNICTSTDGSSWQLQSTQQVSFGKIVSGNGKYALLIPGGLITIDSLTSAASNVPALPGTSTTSLTDLIYGGSTFVGLRSGGLIYSSDDGVNWLDVSGTDIPLNVVSISYSTSKGFVAASSDHNVYTSTDGVTWSIVGASNLLTECGICQKAVNGTNETLVVSNAMTYSSADQITWSLVAGTVDDPNAPVRSQFTANNFYYGVNSSGALVQSTDEITWSVISNLPVGQIYTALHDGSQFIANTSGGGSSAPGIYYSADGISWTKAITYGGNYIYGASVKVGTTTYNFVTSGHAIEDKNKILYSDDGINYLVDDSLNAIIGWTGLVKQAVTNGTNIVGISVNGIFTNASGSWNIEYASNLKDIVWTGTNFVAAGASGLIKTSADGITWTTQTWLNTIDTITDILVVGTTVFSTDSGGKIAISTDHGVNWTLSKDFRVATVIGMNTIVELAYDGATIYGFGSTSDTANVSTVETTDNGTNWAVNTTQGTVVNGHVVYDSGTRFVTTTKQESTISLTGAITWEATTTQLPNDPSFAYIATEEALAGISLSRIHYVSGSPDTYTSGNAGYSEDGQNWLIKTGLTTYHFLDYTPISGVFAKLSYGRYGAVETSIDGINYTAATVTGLTSNNPSFNYMKYINGQYIGINLNEQTGVPGIYTSDDATIWSLISETDLGMTLYESDYNYQSTNIVDMEYDGSQYYLLFNHKDFNTGLNKGVMILTTADLINFTLHETGIHFTMSDLVINVDGSYAIDEIATHSAY